MWPRRVAIDDAGAVGLVTIEHPGIVVLCPIISEQGAEAPSNNELSEDFPSFPDTFQVLQPRFGPPVTGHQCHNKPRDRRAGRRGQAHNRISPSQSFSVPDFASALP